MPHKDQDVVVTGIGALTAAGPTAQDLWEAVLRGEGTARLIDRFETGDLPTRFASEVRDLGERAENLLPRKMLRRTDRYVQLGLIAAGEAWEDAGLNDAANRPDPDRMAVFVGTGSGAASYFEENIRALDSGGFHAMSPFTILRYSANSLSGAVSIRYNILGASATFTTSCASSAYALRAARDEILLGRADIALVIGAEAAVMRGTMAAFGAAGVMSKRNDDPIHAARPFDANRDGFVLGEGSAAIVIERGARARARGAHIRAIVGSVGVSSDAFHQVACLPDGAGASRAMERALKEAHLLTGDVGYINAHGSGTRLNDAAETAAIRHTFGEHADRIPVSSTKPVHGHLIGAAGAVEAVISILSLENQIAPPTSNYNTRDPECDLDYATTGPRPISSPVVLSNSFGFGGVNATVAFTSV